MSDDSEKAALRAEVQRLQDIINEVYRADRYEEEWVWAAIESGTKDNPRMVAGLERAAERQRRAHAALAEMQFETSHRLRAGG